MKDLTLNFLTLEEAERWLKYRDNRNDIAHDYGKKFAAYTLLLLPDVIKDAAALERSVNQHGERMADD